MWGGRFAAQPADAMQAINASIDVDKRLWREDIEGSKAHAAMLAAQGIITRKTTPRYKRDWIRSPRKSSPGTFPFSTALEDIHLNIEARLTERIGEAGKRLHTGRSATTRSRPISSFGQCARRARRQTACARCKRCSCARPKRMPIGSCRASRTCRRRSRVTLGHHLLAYVSMFERDRVRLIGAALEAAWECPLGAAALAGTATRSIAI
jgi:argininosuccinate lyase